MTTKWLVFAAFACLATHGGFAQVSTGTITGSVTDSTGAVVPKAAVRIINEGTSVVRAVTSDSAGIYRAPHSSRAPTGLSFLIPDLPRSPRWG